MLPFSLLFTIGVITALHRSGKVVIITGLPIVMALSVTFGTTVLLNLTLTPMIVATFPILIGLGVDYALHMVNRVEERRRHHIDAAHSENMLRRRRGEDELPCPRPVGYDPVPHMRARDDALNRSCRVALCLHDGDRLLGPDGAADRRRDAHPLGGRDLGAGHRVHAGFQPPPGADLGLAASLQQKIDPGGVGESGSSTRQALVRRGRGGLPDHRGRRGQPRRAV